jgi:hypothetical protein
MKPDAATITSFRTSNMLRKVVVMSETPPNAPTKLPAWAIVIGIIAGIFVGWLLNESRGFSLENIFQAIFAGGFVAYACDKVVSWFRL